MNFFGKKDPEPRFPHTDGGPPGVVGQGGPEIIAAPPYPEVTAPMPGAEHFMNVAVAELNATADRKVDSSVIQAHAQRATTFALLALVSHFTMATVEPEAKETKK